LFNRGDFYASVSSGSLLTREMLLLCYRAEGSL
jgi:hypothetical protein